VAAWLGAGLLAAALAMLAAPTPPAAQAQSGTDELTPEEARLLAQIEESTARRQDLDNKVNDLDRQIRQVRGELNAAEAELDAFEARARGAEVKLEETRRQLVHAEQALKHQAIAAYVGMGDAGGLAEVLLKAENMGAMAAKRSYLRIVASTQTEAIAAYEDLRDRTEDLIGELDETKARAEAERDRVAARRAQLQRERNAQDAVRHEVDHELARHNALLQQVLARREEFTGPVLALKQQSDALEATLRERQVSQTSATSSGGRLTAPIPGARVVSGFGARVHPIYGSVRMHTGVDIAGSTGTPVRAAADGVVVSAGWLGGYGQATVIEHGGPMATLYGHQSQILVKEGQAVDRGQVIGRVGCTGVCTGPHLHYEVRLNGTPVNPASYL
jgi:murein DD-endopeptidase MepM/ murein hydrolase activator NlpD